MKTKKYIPIEQSNKIINRYNLIRNKGLIPIVKKNYIKIGLGCSIICISLITPMTNFILIPIGLFIIGFGFKDIENIKRIIKNKIRGLK